MERPPSQRAQSAAVVVPFLGLFLLLPPLIDLFVGPQRPFGIPLIVLYVFGVWAALVMAAAWLAPRLDTRANPTDPDTPAGREEQPRAPR